MGRRGSSDYILQMNRIFVTGFGPKQSSKEIREYCEESGKEPIIYMSRLNDQSVFLTYINDEMAARARTNLKLNFVKCDYARIRKNSAAAMIRSGLRPPSAASSAVPSSMDLGPRTEPLDIKFRNGDSIRIIAVDNLFKFHAIPSRNYNAYKKHLKTISEYAAEMETLDGKPLKKGNMVAAPYNKEYYRALIMEDVCESDQFAKIFFVDIAKKAQIPPPKLKKVPNAFKATKLISLFYLKGIDKTEKCEYALRCFQTFVDTEWTMESDGESDIEPRSDVMLSNSKQIVATLNVFIQKLMQYSYEESLTIKPPPTGPNRTIQAIDTSNLEFNENFISFIDTENLNEFNEIRDVIHRLGKRIEQFPAYSPRPNEICIVRIDSLWHRAVPMDDDSKNDKALVRLIDYWKIVHVDPQDIRKINERGAKLPIITYTGAIEGYGETIDSPEVDKIRNKFKEDADVQVTEVECTDDVFYLIKI